jgi:pimeloyl-ACP methyl ester carboxylesterase
MLAVMPLAHANGIELYYETFGSDESSPLVLVAGLAMQLISWPDELCEQFAAAGFYVIRFDNRDIGLSTHLDAAGKPDIGIARRDPAAVATYTLDDLADDVAGLLDALSIESAHVLGVSMGGMIAQTVAVRHPGRVRTLTSIMSTVGPRIGPPTPAALATLFPAPIHDREEAGQRSVDTFRVIGSPGYDFPEESLRDVGRRAFDRAYDPAGVGRQLVAIWASGDRSEALSTITAPTLVLHGADDPLVTLPGGQATAAAIPGAELHIYPGMGHSLPRELWSDIVARVTALALESPPGRG